MRYVAWIVAIVQLVAHGVAVAQVVPEYDLSQVIGWETDCPSIPGKGNGHYYTKVRVPGVLEGEQWSWDDARQYAETIWYQGFRGYLFTPTSSDELRLSDWSNTIRNFGFVGGKRNADGGFEWVVGPDVGTDVSGVRWASGEPDGSGDCLWAHASAGLMDERCTITGPYWNADFIVEFGTAPRGLPQGEYVTYFDDEGEWAAAVAAAGGDVISFNTQQNFDMPKADEISSPPGTNTPLGPQLTFRRENTGLPLDFQLRALNVDPAVPARALVYSDNENGWPIFQKLICIGDVDGVPGYPNSVSLYQNDDFEVSVTNRRGQVFAVGMTVWANYYGAGENLKIYGEDGALLDSLTYGLPSISAYGTSEYVFMGVVSDVPISRIVFDERADGDDIAIRDFRFGVADLECLTCTSCTSGMCAAVSDTFVWDRSEDWALGENDPVNPALDQNGCPVWSYEWTTGDGLDSPASWYLNPTTKMLPDKDWYGSGNLRWARGDNQAPESDRWAICHNLSEAYYPGIPVLRWKNCTDGIEEICIDGELDVKWTGSGGVGSPVDIDVVIAHVGAGDGTTTPLLLTTVSKPTNNEGLEVLTIPVSLQTTVSPGDQILISHRGRNSIPNRWIRLVDKLIISNCGEQIGSIAGRVIADCPEEGSGLYGVVVDAFAVGTGDLAASDTTDVAGQFVFEELEAGNYTLSTVTPLGYTNEPGELTVTVSGGATTNADLELACAEIAGEAKGSGFWKHEVGVATGGKGKAHIDAETLCGYLDLVEDHFNSNTINQVVVYQPPASGECADKLLVAKDLLNLKGNVGMTARAKQHLLSLLLNVAAGHVGLMEVASEDSVTVSQAITYCDYLLDDVDDKNDEIAKDVAEGINNGDVIAAGIIPVDIENIAYASRRDFEDTPRHFGLNGAYPNPFNPQTTIAYSVPNSGIVSLRIYDVQGRLVRTVVNEEKRAGEHRAVWRGRDRNGSPVASGIYFVRLDFGSSTQTRKVVLLK
jgi:hypothetical protein